MAQRIGSANASNAEWEKVVRQAEILAPLAQRDRKKRADVDRAAQVLGISTSNAYRLIRLFAADPRQRRSCLMRQDLMLERAC
ncbi:hypothetical protein [Brevundimonas diminuta]|uniref:hypothetical protein n=1 Tax=Brevundimonas diminuta TaxID=293 RepID=UPI003F7F8AE8